MSHKIKQKALHPGRLDREMKVDAHCLMLFVDETGHEEFADQNYPVFGVGGCAVLAAAIPVMLRDPWREMKRIHFGGADVRLHASDLRNPTATQIEAVAKFFKEQEIGRFAVTITHGSKLPDGVTPYQAVAACTKRRWEKLTPRFNPLPSEIAIIHEASERGDALVERYFGDTVAHIDGRVVKVHKGIIPKWVGIETLEVADFIVHAAGNQALRWAKGEESIRKDFKAIFHVNPNWTSFIDIGEMVR
jgi:hypothetical protein